MKNLQTLYLPLSVIFIYLLLTFRSQSLIQFNIVVIATLTYLALSLIRHYQDKTLNIELALEYILIAIFVVVLLANLILKPF